MKMETLAWAAMLTILIGAGVIVLFFTLFFALFKRKFQSMAEKWEKEWEWEWELELERRRRKKGAGE